MRTHQALINKDFDFLKLNHGNAYQTALAKFEKPFFEKVLIATRGNQTQAAEMLGINRGTLRIKLKNLGLYHFQKES